SGARIIIYEAPFRAAAAAALAGTAPEAKLGPAGRVESHAHTIEFGERDSPYERGLGAEAGVRRENSSREERADDDLAVIAFTSGTTGDPKGVMWSHRSVIEAASRSPYTAGVRRGAACAMPLPLFTGGGLAFFFAAMHAGCRSVVIPFDPDAVFDAIEKEHAEVMAAVPSVLGLLLDHPGAASRDRSALKRIAYGGSPMPRALLERLLSFFSCEFIQGFGMTETLITGTLLGGADHVLGDDPLTRRRLQSAGRALEGVSVRVVDEDGNDVAPDGTVGEILIRSFACMSGYWNDPEATKRVLRDGWYHTGDLATMDEDGYISIADRKNDMIISGGFN
ncbi:MAG: class I adenylate-forming enzyme family protein, partial [Vicinamibacteria bacterium]